ncbi:MAG: hypothetical protein GF353_24835 [Candidatus Lokiarchaeota archaeon]|nr:hypothetical protein [Candidatus Lokiarchaeota archaeon]
MEKEDFLKLLPKLIREDDEVKGAIITALSGVVATKDDISRIIEHSDRRFEAVDKRFETLIEQMNRGFEQARKERFQIDAKLESLGRRSGVSLENTILYLLQDKLIQENIQESEINKEYLIDREGKIFWENYSTDIDVLIKDGKTILIEIKYSADNRDGFHLLKKAELYKHQFNREYDKLMIICLEITQFNLNQLEQQGIEIIAGKVIQ